MPKEPLATQTLLEADRIERNCIVLKDGGLRAVILVSGMNFELRSEDEQNAALGSYQNFLNGLDFSVQIFIHSRKINIDGYVNELGDLERKETSDLLKGLMSGYKDFVGDE
jgi:type IV secretory pathway VirB4 component